MSQESLFGEPALKPELSQWHTPMAVARKLAAWVPADARVLEPSCGGGNLIAALIHQGHDPRRITGVELDEKWADHADKRFLGKVSVYCADFLKHAALYCDHDVAITNPPFEGGMHAAFIEALIDIGIPVVLAILPSSIEFGLERDHTLWSKKARVTRRARLPQRVQYGGSFSASFDTVALRIVPRTKPREAGELFAVEETVWTP